MLSAAGAVLFWHRVKGGFYCSQVWDKGMMSSVTLLVGALLEPTMNKVCESYPSAGMTLHGNLSRMKWPNAHNREKPRYTVQAIPTPPAGEVLASDGCTASPLYLVPAQVIETSHLHLPLKARIMMLPVCRCEGPEQSCYH